MREFLASPVMLAELVGEAAVRDPALLTLEDEKGRTLLHSAVELNRHHLIPRLLEMRANPAAQDHRGQTPLHTAAYLGRSNITAQLLEVRAEANVLDDSGQAPLHRAASEGVVV